MKLQLNIHYSLLKVAGLCTTVLSSAITKLSALCWYSNAAYRTVFTLTATIQGQYSTVVVPCRVHFRASIYTTIVQSC